MYDKPATDANIGQYLLIESSYDLARRKLALALRMTPKTGPERWHWMQAVMGWVSVAHFATSFPAQFLYTMAEVESADRKRAVMAFGPPKARAVLQEMLRAAGKETLFLPIPIREFFRFEEAHGLAPPWRVQEKGLTIGDQRTLEMRRGAERRHRRRQKKDRPYLPVSRDSWLNGAGGSPTRTPPALINVLAMQGVPRNSVLKVAKFPGRVPSPDLLMAYVRAWAESVANMSFQNKVADSYIHWLEYMKGFPANVSGMSPKEVADAQKAMAKAKGQAITGTAFTATATVLAATGVAAWIGLVVAAVGALVAALIRVFGGRLLGCPRYPRPPVLRSFKDTEISVSTEGDKNIADTVRAMDSLAAKVDPGAVDEGTDDLPAEDGGTKDAGPGAGAVLIGTGAVIGGILLLRRLRP
jgi:hypothetical protein